MKIQLNKPEAEKILREHFGRFFDERDIESIEIKLPEVSVQRAYIPISAASIHHFAGNGEHKIAAIKFLREATPGLGLYDAKKVVEAIMLEGKSNLLTCNDKLSIAAWITVWDKNYPHRA